VISTMPEGPEAHAGRAELVQGAPLGALDDHFLAAEPADPVLKLQVVVDAVGVLHQVVHGVPRQRLHDRLGQAAAAEDRELHVWKSGARSGRVSMRMVATVR
jgi:hypothetical protein